MYAEDFQLVGVLLAIYAAIYQISFRLPCPEQLQPKNNKDKKTREYYDYYGNYIALSHAISSLLLSAYAFSAESLTFNAPTTFATKLVAYNSLAYFIHDTLACAYYGTLNLAMGLHHVASLLVTSTVFYLQASGSEVAVGLLLAEISNPFNLTREILKYFKRDKTSLYQFLSFGFAGVFVIGRFTILPFFLAALYPSSTHLSVKIMAGFIWFVSWHWLFVIFGFALKAIKEGAANGKPNGWTTAYAMFSRARKSKPFLATYYLGSAWLSFGTLYLAHSKA